MSEIISYPLEVSIVVPIYNEEENLEELLRRVSEAMTPTGRSWELICVDDCSSDTSATLLEQFAASRPWLHPLYLIRNYGQSAAMQAGFDVAAGAVTVTLDVDLQNDPADIPGLLDLLDQRPEVDIISGWRKYRQDRFINRKLPSMIANSLISRMTGVHLHDYGCSLKVYRSESIRDVKIYGELHRFIPALAAQFGAKVIEVPVSHHPRMRGKSKYGIDRTLRVVLDLLWVKFLLRFLHRPMHAFGGAGIALLLPGLLSLAILVVEKLFLGENIGTRPLLLLGVMLTLMGAQLIAMGLLGELLIRIYHEPAGRAQYLLRSGPRRRGKNGHEPSA